MTYQEVKQAWFDESFDLVNATFRQIERLCKELGDDEPAAFWEDYRNFESASRFEVLAGFVG